MEGFSVLALLVGLVVALVMMLAQVKLFSIARTLENILAELQRNRQPAAPQSEPPQAVAATQNAAPASNRTLMDRLGGKL
jgi:hypothetical protein